MGEEPDDTTAFTAMLLEDIRAGEETVEGIKRLREIHASLCRLFDRDPETTSYHKAATIVLCTLESDQEHKERKETTVDATNPITHVSVGDYVVARDAAGIEHTGICTRNDEPGVIRVLALDEEFLEVYECREGRAINGETGELDHETFALFAALQNYLTR